VLAASVAAGAATGAASQANEEQRVAVSLATLLTAARSVISEKQALIDDPSRGDKGLTGAVVLDLARPIYQQALGYDPLATDPASREGALVRAMTTAIVTVMDQNQAGINTPGVAFKGFIPAVYGRLVAEAFSEQAADGSRIKITAPPELVRNRRALPDPWEAEVIKARLQTQAWTRGQAFAQTLDDPSGPVFRMAIPEYYTPSCLSCHGEPKGSLDITGYPREGAKADDLGAVISIALRKRPL